MWMLRKKKRCLILLHETRLQVLCKDRHIATAQQSLSTVLADLRENIKQKIAVSIAVPEQHILRRRQSFEKRVGDGQRQQYASKNAEQWFGLSSHDLYIEQYALGITETQQDLVCFVAIARERILHLRQVCLASGCVLERVSPMAEGMAVGTWRALQQPRTVIGMIDPMSVSLLVCREGVVHFTISHPMLAEDSLEQRICQLRRLWQHAAVSDVLSDVTELMLVDLVGVCEQKIGLPVPIKKMSHQQYGQLSKVGMSLCQ